MLWHLLALLSLSGQLHLLRLLSQRTLRTLRRHTQRFLLTYLTFLPFALWPLYHWATLPVMAVLGFLLLGVENIGEDEGRSLRQRACSSSPPHAFVAEWKAALLGSLCGPAHEFARFKDRPLQLACILAFC